ncbi:DUF1592 domain-containing protein [Zavarzinella formosa]|uniref:DUF1592 domain-containing protein n=1 Tax=Zavarzinella formosa TaxID=360055 RepID=UPI0002DE3664|nr:DUF1592 domain-containing protein [Zavarzinella formosa]
MLSRFFYSTSLVFITSSFALADFAALQAVVADHCVKCHGPTASKGGVRLGPLESSSVVLKNRKLWRNAIAQIEKGEMPPEGEKPVPKETLAKAAAWVKSTLDAADKADRERPDPGRPVIRRLNRGEYNRTIRDLTGVDLDVAGAVGMPDETVGEAFDNLAEALNIPASLMEKYFAAAEMVLDKLYLPPKKKNGKFEPDMLRDKILAPKDPREAIQRFGERVYRRPMTAKETDRYMALFQETKAGGATVEAAMRPVLKAMLVSPNFLLRIEREKPAGAGAVYRISDPELAVRLSYFLWSSMPDDELAKLAAAGELSKPAVLEAQVRRMLADPKAKALTEEFASQWLRLRKLPEARPSTEFFPTFNGKLRQAMAGEATAFFDHLRTGDRSVLELIDADYVFVNADLAKHYDISGVTTQEFTKVALTDPNRGGLLGMGSILAMTSHTSRTSPTLRGKYILDVLLGTPPPPPPPDAGTIDESKNKGKNPKNFREQLAQHASRAVCANCHAKIDPLGFGLENFDAIGRWRPASPDVDSSGKLPSGEQFKGPAELKKILMSRKGMFVENMTGKMLAYALGRELIPSDEPLIKSISADMEKNGYKFSRLVIDIAQSYPMLHRRNLGSNDEAK